ncbi:MAG TPA: sulfotransferase [Nevskiaceae bacterium]|nr:sulfotransferase [Nevskiaceae bacterium]
MESTPLDRVLQQAERATGLADFGPDDFREPLRVYLDLQRNAPLSPEGRLQQEQLVLRCLVNRLRFARDLARHPEILEEDVGDPIVVLGFPRSGTTVLQRMISADPAMQNLALWRVLNPAPLPGEQPGQPIERIAIARATEDAIRRGNPALFTAHPMIAEEAEEDWFLHHLAFQHVGNVFWCLLSPEYLRYLRTLPRLPTYRYVADLLRYLQWQDGGRKGRKWVLKTPVHIGCLDEILAVHPRATFVYPQRDFPTVVASFCHALESSVGTSMAITPRAIGQLTLDFWTAEMARFAQARQRLGDQLNLVQVHYQDLLGDPLRHVRTLYERAGTRLDARGETSIRSWLADNPAGKHGKNVYQLERYGLTPTDVAAAFSRYE